MIPWKLYTKVGDTHYLTLFLEQGPLCLSESPGVSKSKKGKIYYPWIIK